MTRKQLVAKLLRHNVSPQTLKTASLDWMVQTLNWFESNLGDN